MPDCYQFMGNHFGIGKSTFGTAVMKVCGPLIIACYGGLTLGNVQDRMDGVAAMGFLNCAGATDGMYIPILAPYYLATGYINRTGYFSMVKQLLVDHQRHFTNINIDWSGNVHNARIFKNTGLCRKLHGGTFFPDQRITISYVEMPVMILGDPAYPLLSWFMRNHTPVILTAQARFKYRISRCRMTAECALGGLKRCWHCLLTKLDLSEVNTPMIITACCVLYKICEAKGEKLPPEWR